MGYLKVDDPSFDLLAAIQKVRGQSRIKWYNVHVGGIKILLGATVNWIDGPY